MFRLQSLVIAALVGAAAGVPTAARSNAKLEPGIDLALVAGVQMLFEGENEAGETTEATGTTHIEVDLQFASVSEGGSGFAVQAKVPINFFYSSLDAYYQLAPPNPQTYLGVGAELGIAPGVYGVYTRFLTESLFFTFTPRLLLAGSSDLFLNPQVALGYSTPAIELTAFGAFAYATGNGIDVELDLFSDEDRKDYRDQLGLFGVAARF